MIILIIYIINSFLWPEYFIDFFMWKMDPMSSCDIRLVFTLQPRDSTLRYKSWVHLWNNFPCIITLHKSTLLNFRLINSVEDINYVEDCLKEKPQFQIINFSKRILWMSNVFLIRQSINDAPLYEASFKIISAVLSNLFLLDKVEYWYQTMIISVFIFTQIYIYLYTQKE